MMTHKSALLPARRRPRRPALTVKSRIAGPRAVHRYGYRGGNAVVALNTDQVSRHSDVVHPVVRVHRETGRKALYVNHGFTVRVVGMDDTESRGLLDEPFAHCLKPDFQYRHAWRRPLATRARSARCGG